MIKYKITITFWTRPPTSPIRNATATLVYLF